MEKSRAIELLEHLAWDRDIDRNPYGDALNIAIDALKAQLSQEGTTSDLISKQWLLDCINEGWIKFDTDKDANRFIHLVRDIAPSAQPEPTDIDAREAVYNLAEKIGIHQLFALTVELRGEPIQPEPQWIPFTTRPLTEEEKEEYSEWDRILVCELPDDGQRILVSVSVRGHESV